MSDISVSDADAIRNGMKRCSECSGLRCKRLARQVSPALRWCSRFTAADQAYGQRQRNRRQSPIAAMIESLEVA